MQSRGRRRSMPIFRTELVNDSDNESETDEDTRARSRRPHRRHNRKHSKKCKHKKHNKENSDSDEAANFSQYKRDFDSLELQTDMAPSIHRLSIEYDVRANRKYSDGSSHRGSVPTYLDEPAYDVTDKTTRRASYSLLRTPELYYHSSSSSLASDAKGTQCYSHPVSPEKHRLNPGSYNSHSSHSHRKERRRHSKVTLDTNFLVPDYRVRRDRSCSSGSNSSAKSILSALTDCDRPEINQIPFTQGML